QRHEATAPVKQGRRIVLADLYHDAGAFLFEGFVGNEVADLGEDLERTKVLPDHQRLHFGEATAGDNGHAGNDLAVHEDLVKVFPVQFHRTVVHPLAFQQLDYARNIICSDGLDLCAGVHVATSSCL